jgi:membrane associated rhomboid family serine protease
LGASGNIMALTAYFACVYPQASFLLFGIVPVPAWLCVSGLVGYDVMTGHAGHVGGALYGGLYYLYKNRRRIPGRRW